MSWQWFADVGLWWWQWRWWVEGSGPGGGLVVSGLFGFFFFLMGLRLVCGWIFAGFVVGLVSWWLLGGGDWVSVWMWSG